MLTFDALLNVVALLPFRQNLWPLAGLWRGKQDKHLFLSFPAPLELRKANWIGSGWAFVFFFRIQFSSIMSFWGVDSLLGGTFLCLLVLVNPIPSPCLKVLKCRLHSPPGWYPPHLSKSRENIGWLWGVLCHALGSHFPPHPAPCQVNRTHTVGGMATHRPLLFPISTIWCLPIFTSSL